MHSIQTFHSLYHVQRSVIWGGDGRWPRSAGRPLLCCCRARRSVLGTLVGALAGRRDSLKMEVADGCLAAAPRPPCSPGPRRSLNLTAGTSMGGRGRLLGDGRRPGRHLHPLQGRPEDYRRAEDNKFVRKKKKRNEIKKKEKKKFKCVYNVLIDVERFPFLEEA